MPASGAASPIGVSGIESDDTPSHTPLREGEGRMGESAMREKSERQTHTHITLREKKE